MTNSQRLANDPKEIRVKAIRLNRGFAFVRGNITSLDENLFAQRDSDGIPSDG